MGAGGYQGLPQTGMTPLVHYGGAVARHISWIHGYYGAQCNTHIQGAYNLYTYPEIGNSH